MVTNRDITNVWAEAIINYLGKSCLWCGDTEKLNIHHEKPLHAGGLNELSNLIVLCEMCHQEAHRQLKKIYPIDYKQHKESEKAMIYMGYMNE